MDFNKSAAYLWNYFEIMKIILRIIDEFKKEFPERIIGKFKNIIDLSIIWGAWVHV